VNATLSIFCASNCAAQISAARSDTVQTVAGQLAITKVASPGIDAVIFNVLLDGRDIDKLYGLNHIYYPDSGVDGGLNGRVLMEDFIGGASATPVITVYDFREKPPLILQVTDKLDVDDVRWRSDGVLLEASNQWYLYRRGKLSKTNSISR
jgi:hypothetical protein